MTGDGTFDFRSLAEQSFDFLDQLAGMVGLREHPHVVAAKRVIAANPGDEQTVRQVTQETAERIIQSPVFKRAMRNRSPFGRSPGPLVSGPILLGTNPDPVLVRQFPVGLYPHELQQNILLCGRAGAGKTNFIYFLLESLLRMGIPFWIVDFKQDYRHLLRKTSDVLIFNSRTFRFNPLRCPPGTEPVKWLQTFCEVFCQVFFTGASTASKNLLLSVVDRLYQEHGVYDGTDSYPTLVELDGRLDPSNFAGKVHSQDLQRMYTCLNKTRPLVRLLESMLREDPGFDLEALLNRNVVFEFDGLTNEYQEFLINILLFRVFLYRIDNGQRGPLRHTLIYDEAKMVYAQDRAKPSSHITRLTSMAREFGEALIVSDQMPSSLGEAIKANVFTTITQNLSSMKDIQAMAYGMGLNPEQRDQLISLPIGTAIVRFADRYPKPFLLRVPRVRIAKDVSDAEVERHMRPIIDKFSGNASHENSAPPPQHPEQQTDPRPQQPKAALPVTESEEALSAVASRLLIDIRSHPFRSAVERYDALALNPRTATEAVRQLVKAHYLHEIEIPGGGRGRPGKYFEMTSKAEQKVGRQNLGPGKGGFVHRYFQRQIQQYFEILGYPARIEAYQNGKAVDIGVWKTANKVAVEVEMSPAHALENIRKDLSAGWDCVVVGYPNDSVARKIQAEIQNHPEIKVLSDRIELISVRKLMPN